ncbi:MAG: extracellular solute-binding protein [Clostridia bacterium]|nr:extracellular solute-binding protein [Clostridia bacterium]
MKKIISSILTVCVLLCPLLTAVTAAEATADKADTVSINNTETGNYRTYLSKLDLSLKGGDIEIPCHSATALYGGAEPEASFVVFPDEDSSAEFTFNVEAEANYCAELTFVPLSGSNFGNSSIGFKVNGEYPFDEARELDLFWRWQNSERATDKRGNEILSSMTFVEDETAVSLADPSGRQELPLLFKFSKGINTVTVVANTGNFKLLGIRLYSPSQVKSYEEYSKQNSGLSAVTNQNLVLEAEDYLEASSTTLTPDYDKSSVDTSPNDPVKLLYNYISDDKYRSPGQWLKWEFVPEQTGMYEISMRVRQNSKSGFSVARRLYINGEVPFEECEEIRFDYRSDWYVKDLGGDKPYSFYFEAGKKYTLILEVTAGSLSEITGRIDDLVYRLNSFYRSAVMVIGNDPDTYRDYQLHKVIPDFEKSISDFYEELKTIVEALENRNSGRSGSSLSSFHSLMNRLQRFKKNPDLFAKNMSSFKGEIQALSSWNQDAKEQPLDIDYISIHSPDQSTGRGKVQFFRQLAFDLKRIVASFTSDYGVVGDIYDQSSSLKIWMSSGRDQMNILKKLVDNSFSTEYGIKANISLVTVDIRTAVLAGTAPDVSLFLSGDMPASLAMRGAIENLSEYEGFAAVAERFSAHSLKPFELDGGCYALPISETFNMMFVRTDIFEELGLSIPETWEEFYQVSTILQRNNLEVGIPANIGMFATLLFQNGGEFYNSGLNQTDFGSEAAIEAFKTWTGLFARYGFPLTYDFYNRFSSGEMPLAITDYTQYLKVEAASPELSGRWEMCLIPGTVGEDGSLNRAVSISAASGSDTSPGLAQSVTSAVMFSASKHKEKAWKFLSWLTSDEIQSAYGRELEDALGSISRYTSANINAFKTLPWSKEQRTLLETQRSSIVALNEISGNYSVTRELINAFRKVVYNNANATDTIYTYNKRINKELERKTKKN